MQTNPIYILGISAYYHDSAAVILVNGEIIAAAEEERFTREKHTRNFPVHAITYCLKEAKITLEMVNALIFYDKPLLKFERLMETAYLNVPFGFRLFHASIPVWMKSKINMRKTILKELKQVDSACKFEREKIKFTTHHLAHAASAFFPSPYANAAILTIDGVGEWATATIGKGTGNKLELIKQMNFPNSVGLLYSAFTYFLGFKVNEGEYKLMGLSPYGDIENQQTKTFIELIKNNLITIYADGSIKMNLNYFAYTTGVKMIKTKKWEKLFTCKCRKSTEKINSNHANLALAIQLVTEEIVLRLVATAKKLTGSKNLVMAGGVALNSVANGKVLEKSEFENIWIQPAAGDSGGALGAALIGHFLLTNANRNTSNNGADFMQGAFLGPSISPAVLTNYLAKHPNIKAKKIEHKKDMVNHIADLIVDNKIIGWVQGRMEFGPRALGARSIIASALQKKNQTAINKKVKFREDFRPFAPVMLPEEGVKYYGFKNASGYMQFVKKIKTNYRRTLPANFDTLPIYQKVAVSTSVFEAVTHVDFSSRLQIVGDEKHPFYMLLQRLKEITGYGILLNTSFNSGGEPIVCSVNDIFDCFHKTEMDYLVIENWLISKSE